MSLEPGRKLGLVSSLLFVILPIITVALMIGFLTSVITTALSMGSTANPAAILGSAAGFTISIVIIAALVILAIILGVVAMYSLSHYYNERGIFTGVIYALIIYIVTAICSIIAEFAFLIPALSSLSPSTTTPSTAYLGQFFGIIVVFAVIAIVVMIVVAVLIMRALNKLAEKSGEDSFKTAGLLILIGVLLSIVAVGVIVLWIGFIFAAIGFYRLKPLPPPAATPVYTNQPVTLEQKKICPYCGAENSAASIYCRNCGKPI